jgi:hypothetical protein
MFLATAKLTPQVLPRASSVRRALHVMERKGPTLICYVQISGDPPFEQSSCIKRLQLREGILHYLAGTRQ